MIKGKMLCGIIKDDLIIRTGQENYKKTLSKPHTRPMDFTGRPMKGFLYVESEGYKNAKLLSSWINMGIDPASKLK